MAKDKVVSFVKARRELSRIIDRVRNGSQPVTITKRQQPVAVIIGLSRYRQMTGASKYLKHSKGKRILKIRGIATGVADIDEAISALRKSRIDALTRSF